MLGLVITPRTLVRQSTWTSTICALLFPICFSKSGMSVATWSITFSFSACCADRLTASRTAFSAQSALRLRSSARPRM
ncbi:hypothetical protein D3C83_45500 [compost metagenome]